MHLAFSSHPDRPAGAAQAKQELNSGVRVKFVMSGKKIDGMYDDVHVSIFQGDETHAVMARHLLKAHPDHELIGGGKMEGSDVWWESNTCVDEFGHDRPTSLMLGEMLLQEMEEGLSALS